MKSWRIKEDGFNDMIMIPNTSEKWFCHDPNSVPRNKSSIKQKEKEQCCKCFWPMGPDFCKKSGQNPPNKSSKILCWLEKCLQIVILAKTGATTSWAFSCCFGTFSLFILKLKITQRKKILVHEKSHAFFVGQGCPNCLPTTAGLIWCGQTNLQPQTNVTISCNISSSHW